MLETLLRYWRFDRVETWEQVGALLSKPCPSWQKVEGILNGMAAVHSGGHQTYWHPELAGVKGIGQSIAVLRSWSHKETRKALAAVDLSDKPTALEVVRVLRRLEGCGIYTVICVVGALWRHGWVSWGKFGLVGMGAVAVIDHLRGNPRRKRRHAGVWPWSRDADGYRNYIHQLALLSGAAFPDMQHSLCNYHMRILRHQ